MFKAHFLLVIMIGKKSFYWVSPFLPLSHKFDKWFDETEKNDSDSYIIDK